MAPDTAPTTTRPKATACSVGSLPAGTRSPITTIATVSNGTSTPARSRRAALPPGDVAVAGGSLTAVFVMTLLLSILTPLARPQPQVYARPAGQAARRRG